MGLYSPPLLTEGGGEGRGGRTRVGAIKIAFSQNKANHQIGTVGVVYTSLEGVKSYDQGKIN